MSSMTAVSSALGGEHNLERYHLNICQFDSRLSLYPPLVMLWTLTGRRLGRGMLTFTPAKMDLEKAPAVSYQKMLCFVLQEVRDAKGL